MKVLQKLIRVLGFSAYEAANPSPRRSRVPGNAPSDTRKELTSHTRRELVRKSRYLHKNSGFAREIVSDMAIYSTGDGMRPQAQTADPNWNNTAENHFMRWAARCEITNRFSFAECQSLISRGLDVDGEYYVLKVRDRFGYPRLQLLESHRIGDSSVGDTQDGIIFDAYGAPYYYRVLLDEGYRDVIAGAVMHIFEPESVSAVRNAPTYQHSINHLLDENELIALEKHAVKDNAGISRVLKSEDGTLGDNADFGMGIGADGEPTDPQAVERIIGGKVVSIKTNESLETHQPNRPSPVFTGFLEHLKRDSAAGVLPYEFVLDPGGARSAGIRLVVAKADRRFSYRQMILIQRFLKPTWGFVIGDAINTGQLAPMKGWNKVLFTTPKRVTVDAGRESESHRKDVEMGLTSFSEHFAELGQDFDEQLEIRAQNAKKIVDAAQRYGVPVTMLYRPSGTQMVAEASAPAANEQSQSVDKDM